MILGFNSVLARQSTYLVLVISGCLEKEEQGIDIGGDGDASRDGHGTRCRNIDQLDDGFTASIPKWLDEPMGTTLGCG